MRKPLTLLVLLILLLSICPLFSIAHALPADSMWIVPPSLNFNTNSTSAGYKFNVTVWLNMSTPANAWQIFMVYDKTQLKALHCWYSRPDHLQSQWSYPLPIVSGASPSFGDNTTKGGHSGYVLYTEVLANGANKTGCGSCAIVQFNVTVAPLKYQTLLSMIRLDQKWGPIYGYALDSNGYEIPLTFGYANYKFSSPWTAPPPASLYVDPPKIKNPLLTLSHNFTINIAMSKATNVSSFAFKLGFDKSILKAWEAHLGSFFPPSAVPTIIIDNSSGFVQVSAHLIALPTVSGNGTLATIKFHVESLGQSSLHLYDVAIQDDLGRTLPSNTADGYFNNVLLAELYVDPPKIIDPTLLPPKTFDVNITLNDVENLYGYEFNMSFDKNALTCLYVIIQDVKGETNYAPESQVSNAKGFAWVRVAYFPPAVPITTYSPVALVTIHFRVKSPGVSILHLHDTSLTNSTGGTIPHEDSDGFVETLVHDVAVIGVTPSSPWAYAGWPVDIAVIAKNLGKATENFNVTAYANTTLIGMIPVTGLVPNTQTVLNFTWDTTGFPGAAYVISANASILQYELNTTNNRFIDGTVSILTVKHDVAITNITREASWAYEGWLVKINVTAANLGGFPETFNVTTFYNSTAMGTVHIASLSANTSIKLTFIWNTAGLASQRNYTISARATLVPFEYNVSNNILVDGKVQVRIVGDVNGDGIVDARDLSLTSRAFGGYGPNVIYQGCPASANWNPECDLNRDGVVDVRDLAKVAQNYGKLCPP